MTEPSLASAVIGWLSGVFLVLFGVDYYAIVWAFMGTLGALYFREQNLGSLKSLAYIAFSTLAGAAIATGLIAISGVVPPYQRPILILLSLVIGGGWQSVMAAILEALISRIKKFGGSQ